MHQSFRTSRLNLSCLLLLAAILSLTASKSEEWKRITSKDGKISALFPSDIKDNPQSQIDRTPAGKVKSVFGEHHGNGILLAGSVAHLPRLARAAGGKAILNASKKTFLEQAQGTEISFRETNINDTPARILIYKGAAYQGKGKPYQGAALLITVNKRVYIFNSVITSASDKNKAAEKKLFGSIKIIK